MPKIADELGPLAVSRLKTPGFWPVGGVAGLALRVTPTESRHWVLRVVVAGKRRDVGLGAYPGVTLAAAREKAAEARSLVRNGIDPVEQARAARSQLQAETAKALTFEQCAAAFIKAHREGWKNAKHAQQWQSTLAQWAFPKMGALLVRDVDQAHVLAVLEQPANHAQPEGPNLWGGKTETASRVRGRIESVLAWATARGMRQGENPARWRGHLDKLLPKPSKVAKVEHHAALPVADMGAFMVRLRQMQGSGARALEFAILTAARSGEVRGMTWAELDLQVGIWTVPASRMKAKKEHRVPLSNEALALIKAQPRIAETEFVFAGAGGRMLSDMTLTATLRRMEVAATAHGFRSTFRDWAGERTAYPREVIEHALAHQLKDKAEAAYARGDLFDKRRRLMQDWSAFVDSVGAPSAEVIPMNRATA
jgi:integrase